MNAAEAIAVLNPINAKTPAEMLVLADACEEVGQTQNAQTWQHGAACALVAASAKLRRRLRELAGARPHVPVRVTLGADAPALLGESCHWTTPSGAPVSHPNAYRRAWGKPVYHASTVRVEVGHAWILANA